MPHAIADVVMRALELEPDRRYASAAAMDAALAAVETRVSAPGVSLGPTSGRPGPMPTPSTAPPPASRTASRVLGWTLGIGAVILLGGLLFLTVAALGLYAARDELRAWVDGSASAPSAAPPAPSPMAPALPRPSLAPPAPAPALPMPMPAPAPSPPATSDVSGVRVVATTLGLVDADGVREVGERARPALAACRGVRAYHEQLQFMVNPGGALMASGLPTDGAAHDCVVTAIESAGPVRTIMTGIARFDVTLDPR